MAALVFSRSRARRRSGVGARAGWRAARTLVLLALAALFVRSLVAMPRVVPSESMLPTLLVGDYVLVSKSAYGWSRFSLPGAPALFSGRLFAATPARGDVVVFRGVDGQEDLVKRVIGLPGDRIAMRAGRLLLNGTEVPRTRLADFVAPIGANTRCRAIDATGWGRRIEHGTALCRFPRYRETLPGGRRYAVIDQGATPQDDAPPVVVPAGHYFVLGDNRDMSADSRFPPPAGAGAVAAERLLGRVVALPFSVDGSARATAPQGWLAAIRWPRIGLLP